MDIIKSESASSKQLSFEFIKCYVSSNNTSKSDIVDQLLVSFITDLDNKHDYQYAMKLISNSRFENKLPASWNDILKDIKSMEKEKAIIKDKETIDWLINIGDDWLKSNILQSTVIKEDNDVEEENSDDEEEPPTTAETTGALIVKFESSELVEYANSKFQSNSLLSFKLDTIENKLFHYEFPFIIALSNCNINELTRISSKFSENDKFGKYFIKDLKFNKEITTHNINELIQYLNSNDYGNIGEQLFEQMVLSITRIKHVNPNFNLKEITEINFTRYPELTYNELANSFNNPKGSKVVTLSPLVIELMVNIKDEYNLLLAHPSNFIIYDNNAGLVLLQDGRRSEDPTLTFKSNWKLEDIVSCIESLVKKFKPIPGYMAVCIMIDHFYKELLQVDQLPTKTLKYIYGLIKHNRVPTDLSMDLSIFHPFYYLCLKSPKLENYLLNHPFFTDVLWNRAVRLEYYWERYDYNYQGYDIRKYLDPQEFTFEYIFGKCIEKEVEDEKDNGAPFDEILGKLMYHISHLPGLTDNGMINFQEGDGNNDGITKKLSSYHNDSLNYNLQYCLQIKRVDLFLKEFEYIKQFETVFNQHQQQLLLSNQQQQTLHIALKNPFTFEKFTFSDRIIDKADKLMDLESFQTFISNPIVIKTLKELNDGTPNGCESLSNYKDTVNQILLDNDINGFLCNSSCYTVLRDQQTFPEINSFQTISSLNIIKSFNSLEIPCYDLKFHQLTFKLFPNDQPLITIEIQDVVKAIKHKKINFLKFYIENNLIKNNLVIQYLKNTLSNHYNFKHININWSN